MELERLIPILLAVLVFVASALARRGRQGRGGPSRNAEVPPQPRAQRHEPEARSSEGALLPEAAYTPRRAVRSVSVSRQHLAPPHCLSSRQIMFRLLRQPAGARTAILLGEVLRPPVGLRPPGNS